MYYQEQRGWRAVIAGYGLKGRYVLIGATVKNPFAHSHLAPRSARTEAFLKDAEMQKKSEPHHVCSYFFGIYTAQTYTHTTHPVLPMPKVQRANARPPTRQQMSASSSAW